MDYQSIIDKYYPEDGDLRRLLIKHSRQVADRCLLICNRHPELCIDRDFVEEAAMLHDIGVRWCNAPSICCHGTEPYLLHGQIGGEGVPAACIEPFIGQQYKEGDVFCYLQTKWGEIVEIPAAIGGKLVDISVKPGQLIRQGDTIAWIERQL